MEVMIAGTILALAVASTMGVLGGARSSLLRAEQRWARSHLLAQVAELYLLGGPNAEIPDGLLPAGYSSACELYEVEDGIHEEAMEHIRQWLLAEYHISVYDASGKMLSETFVRKVLKEEDVE